MRNSNLRMPESSTYSAVSASGNGLSFERLQTFPFTSAADLKNSYIQLAEYLSADSSRILPEWARDEAGQLLERRKIVICGSVCPAEIRMLARHAEVIGIVDDFKRDTKVFGIPVMDSDAWIEMVRADKTIVSCLMLPNERGYRFFMRLCLQWEIPFLGPLQVMHLIKTAKIDIKGYSGIFLWYGYEFYMFALENYRKLVQLSDHLEDEFSRFSWFSILMYRMTLNPVYLESCAVGRHTDAFRLDSYAANRRFLKFSDNEVYIDAGTFTGDTVETFLRAVNGKFKHIYTFEPSAPNNREIRRRLNKLQNEYLDSFVGKVSLIQKGLWDSETTLLFNSCTLDSFDLDTPVGNTNYVSDYGAAHIVDSGFFNFVYDNAAEKQLSEEVSMTTIDSATNQDATYIKFEIEGSELPALRGGIKTIERNRPQMAISIYHKPEDFVTLTEFVLNTDLGYRFGFRQHDPLAPYAMVLYCYR